MTMERAEIDQDSARDDMTAELAQEQPTPPLGAGLMECPVCGHPMPDLRGGKATICPACGFKDSCCY
jgi:rubrerythrin